MGGDTTKPKAKKQPKEKRKDKSRSPGPKRRSRSPRRPGKKPAVAKRSPGGAPGGYNAIEVKTPNKPSKRTGKDRNAEYNGRYVWNGSVWKKDDPKKDIFLEKQQ